MVGKTYSMVERTNIIGDIMFKKRHLRGLAKTAMKVSPVPIPDIVKEQISGATDKISELAGKIDKMQESLDVLLELFSMEDDDETTSE